MQFFRQRTIRVDRKNKASQNKIVSIPFKTIIYQKNLLPNWIPHPSVCPPPWIWRQVKAYSPRVNSYTGKPRHKFFMMQYQDFRRYKSDSTWAFNKESSEVVSSKKLFGLWVKIGLMLLVAYFFLFVFVLYSTVKLMKKAFDLYKMKKYEKVIEVCDFLIKNGLEDSFVYNLKGSACVELKQYEAAIQCFDQAIKLESDPTYYYNKAHTLLLMGKYSEGLPIFDTALSLTKALSLTESKILRSMILSNKSICLLKTNNAEESLILITEAIAENPVYMDLHYNKASILTQLGSFDKAMIILDAIIAHEPNYFLAHFGKGHLYRAKKDYKNALNCYQQAIATNKHKQDFPLATADVYASMGLILAYMGRTDEALVCLNEAIELAPNNLEYYYNKAILLAGKYSVAMETIDAALKIDSQNELILKAKSYVSNLKEVREGMDILFLEKEILPVVEDVASDGNIFEAIEKGSTALVASIVNNNRGSIILNDANYNTPIEVAFGHEKWEILKDLLRDRPAFSREDLDRYLDKGAMLYKETANHEVQNSALIDSLVSQITHTNILALRTNRSQVIKYYGHLKNLGGIAAAGLHVSQYKWGPFLVLPNNQESYLEGWEIADFLSLRIRVYFEVLVKNLVKKTGPGRYTDKQIEQLKEELLLELETLRARRDFLTILHAPHEKKLDLIIAHTINVADKVRNIYLPMGYVYPSGHMQHAVYVNFLGGGKLARVDNLGDGSEKHNRGSKADEIMPCLAKYFSNNVDILAYVNDIIEAKLLPSRAAKDKLYSEGCSYKHQEIMNGWKQKPKQTVGNCVLVNFDVGQEIRLKHELFSMLKKDEMQAVTVLEENVPNLLEMPVEFDMRDLLRREEKIILIEPKDKFIDLDIVPPITALPRA